MALGAWGPPPGVAAAPNHRAADPGPGVCTITATQVADATRIELGRTVGLEVTIAADCPAEAQGRADIILGVDRSSSMGELGKFEAAKTAVRQFIAGVDFSRHRVGLMPFSDSAYILQPLTTRVDDLLSAVDAIDRPHGSTDIAAAISVADRELEAAGRTEAVAVIVLLTDGRSSEEPMLAAAIRAGKRATVIFTIGLGEDAAHDALRRVATSSDYYYYAPGPADLTAIYDQIAATIRNFTVTGVALVDQLSDGVSYVAGSAEPTEPGGSRELTWWRGYLPDQPVAYRYRVQVFRPGRVQLSAAVWIDYSDGDGARRRIDIAPATVEVIIPETHYVFLPIAWRNQCVPATTWADVVLVLDVSSSMLDGDKLAQAVTAAGTFLDLMLLPADRAAIVTYDAQARLVEGLSGDRAALEQALAGLVTGNGTRLDHGLEVATMEFMSPRHRQDNRPVIVFLSDGRQMEERERVYDAAAFARTLGITIFTIALGTDADRAILAAVAGDRSRAFYAPGTADLAEIYRQVGGVVGCR